MNINIFVTNECHVVYTDQISSLIYISAQERGTGIAKRSSDYLIEKIRAGKAVIALTSDKQLAGFAYIETWSHSRFVANSGLIVAHQYRQTGLAKRIKEKIFNLSRSLYPDAKIFSITTGLAVMKINSDMGFKPVPFSELTDDIEFWKGCQGCKNFDILERNNYKMCLCTGLLYDPSAEKSKNKQMAPVLSMVGKAIVYPFMSLYKLTPLRKQKV